MQSNQEKDQWSSFQSSKTLDDRFGIGVSVASSRMQIRILFNLKHEIFRRATRHTNKLQNLFYRFTEPVSFKHEKVSKVPGSSQKEYLQGNEMRLRTQFCNRFPHT